MQRRRRRLIGVRRTWRKAALQDTDPMHAILRGNHSGGLDPMNPDFKICLRCVAADLLASGPSAIGRSRALWPLLIFECRVPQQRRAILNKPNVAERPES
jgi:hypothetical protein